MSVPPLSVHTLCPCPLELSRAPFKGGKLPNGGVGMLVNYNNEDVLISAEVSDRESGRELETVCESVLSDDDCCCCLVTMMTVVANCC